MPSAKFFSIVAISRKKVFAATAAAVVAASLPMSGGQPAGTPSNELIIRNVRVFDGIRVIPKGDVWIENGHIKAVGQDLKAPVGAPSIDASGETLLPGLIDAHTHVWGDALKQALMFGVTTELDMFTRYQDAQEIKKAQSEGKDLDMADLRSAGTLVTAPKGHGTEYGMHIPTIISPAEAQAFVDARIAEGSDYIKIIYDDGKAYGTTIPTISKETMAAVVAAAHKRGKMAVAHIGSLQGAKDAIEAGADGLAHLFIDAPPDPEFVDLAVKHHIFVVPTLSVLASITGSPSGELLATDLQLRPYLSPDVTANLRTSFPRHSGNFNNPEEAVRMLKARHVPLLAGTDSPNPGTAHGISIHGELELLVGAGMTPVETLIAATSTPATLFHLDDRGRIAPGKRADLLLVKGDPTTDIKATRDIVSVWKLGVQVDRASYRASVEKTVQQSEAQKKAPAPPGSEPGLISDFDEDKPSVKFGQDWQVSTDSFRGGKSTAEMKVVDGGAENSKGALQITGEVVPGQVSWAGVIFFPGPTPMAPVNLSSKKAISFWARGDARSYCVMAFEQSAGYIPKTLAFNAESEWQKITLPLSRFETDGHDLMGIFIGACSPPGHFKLEIDNVRME
jgi:imidazolonepropionase-like amidohydrolase